MAKFFLTAALLATACRELPPPQTLPTPTPPLTLRLGVADTAVPFTDLTLPAYAAVAPETRIQLVSANAATLLADLQAGQLDAILLHHLPEDAGLWFSPVAVDGLVLLAHPANPLAGLSRGQAQALFGGQIGSWDGVGGAETAVTLVTRERGSGARAIFERRIMAEQRVSINAVVAADDPAVRAAVAAAPGAIGYSMMAAAADAADTADGAAPVVALTIDGVPAAPATTASQAYPLTAPLYFAAPAEPQGALRAFLAWLQSDAGQAVIGEKYGRVRAADGSG